MAWSRASASVLFIQELARFSENCICRIASSIGRPATCRESMLSFRGEILW
jgi:hypothetical protein